MPWDIPGPWVTGNFVTAAEMNAFRDSLVTLEQIASVHPRSSST